MPKPLDDRIAAALGQGARVATVAELITEVGTAITEAQAEHDRLDALSKSATASEPEADAAADEAGKLARRIVRLGAKKEQLEARHAELLDSDRRKRALAEYTAAKETRDALAVEIETRWPALCDEMISLLDRIEASDRECERVSRNSYGEGPLESAEIVARGVPGNYRDAAGWIPRLGESKITSLRGRGNDVHAWPRHVNHFAALEAQQHAHALQLKANREAEARRWQRFMVTAPADKRVAIETRRGGAFLEPGRTISADMSQEFVAAARKSGCTVEALKPGETLGMRPSAAVLT